MSGEHRVGLTFRPGLPNLGGGVNRERTAVEPAPRRERASAPEQPKPSPATAPMPKAAPAAATTSKAAAAPPPATAPKSAPTATSAVPAAKPVPPTVTRVPDIARPGWIVVMPGETLTLLAQRWGTSVVAIMEANNLVNDQVAPGKQLRLPPASKR